jgi:hypothetical protein
MSAYHPPGELMADTKPPAKKAPAKSTAKPKPKPKPKPKSPTYEDLLAARVELNEAVSEVAAARNRLRAAQSINDTSERVARVGACQDALNEAQERAQTARTRLEELRAEARL